METITKAEMITAGQAGKSVVVSRDGKTVKIDGKEFKISTETP